MPPSLYPSLLDKGCVLIGLCMHGVSMAIIGSAFASWMMFVMVRPSSLPFSFTRHFSISQITFLILCHIPFLHSAPYLLLLLLLLLPSALLLVRCSHACSPA